jgi:AcrR family transcriptional regulator
MVNTAIETRAMILKTALSLFMEKGYKDTSYQDLVKETGLSKGAIYHHFKSKEDILTSVFEYMSEASNQAVVFKPEGIVKDVKSFIKLYTDIKRAQIKGFKEFMGTKKLKFNKFLFFFEAVNENVKLRTISAALLRQEIKFLENCFLCLKKANKLPKGKDPLLLAESLYYMLEGAGVLMLFIENSEKEEDWVNLYKKTMEDFFKII